MNTYTYSGNYFNITVQEALPEDGLLNGQYGELHFKRCSDGYAIYDSAFLGSGFVSTPTSAVIGYPAYINDVPVTEIHHKIKINSAKPIAIEGQNIKRAYLSIDRKTYKDIANKDVSFAQLLSAMLNASDHTQMEQNPLEISINFYNKEHSVELCEIRCDEKCILHGISAKCIKVIAPTVILKGKAYELLERIEFTGRVYPHKHSDWSDEVQDTEYFSNIKSLKVVEGSLHGNICWSFNDCISLEHVHLANGILKIPPTAFFNCSSLTDLYIPDTVTEIGEYAFAGCTKLASIHLPSNIKKIPRGLFLNCKSLMKCYISDSIEEIEDKAFQGCVALRKPWIPKGIKKIGKEAFDDPSWGKLHF